MLKRMLSTSCCTTRVAIAFWGMTFAILYLSGELLRTLAPAVAPYGDTISLASLAAACFFNFQRNRTLHCGVTGPVFACAAVAAALVESRAWQFDERLIWAVVVPVVAAAFALEWRMTRSASR